MLRGVEAKLSGRSKKLLVKTCMAVGMEEPFPETSSGMIAALISAEYLHKTAEALGQSSSSKATAFVPSMREEIEKSMAASQRGNLPVSVLQRLQQDADEDAGEAKRAETREAPPPELFSPRRAGGRPLSELKVGEELSGRVVAASLLDGLRVDLGAEAEALVPCDASLPELAGLLGETVRVRLEDVRPGAAGSVRRFPLLARLLGVEGVGRTSGSARALQLGRGSDSDRLHILRGDGTNSPAANAAQYLVEESVLEAATPSEELKAAAAAPPRPPPEEVLSMDSDGALRFVEVPAATIEEASGTPVAPEAREAWRAAAKEELSLASMELRCRDQLALDLQEVETDLANGRAPSLAVSLLGMIKTEDGKACLLPRPQGDTLIFRLLSFGSADELEEHVRSAVEAQQEAWSHWAARPKADMTLLRAFFGCAEAVHCRGVHVVQSSLLRNQAEKARDRFDALLDCSDLIAELTQAVKRSEALADNKALAERGGFFVKPKKPKKTLLSGR